jgi:acyl-CoA synthetase (NDP forming)
MDPATIHETLGAMALLARNFSPLSAETAVTIEELEINPLKATPDGRFVALDALIRISKNKFSPLYPAQSGIDKLLKPYSAIILGASAKKINIGRIILKNLCDGERVVKSSVYVLHPRADEIDGCRCFHSIDEIDREIDMAVYAIPAGADNGLLERMIRERKARAVMVIPGGFGETEKGKSLERDLEDAIRTARERDSESAVINGPNCLGIVSRAGGYNTFFLPEHKLPFIGEYGDRMALISQSGAYIVTMVSNMGKLINPKYMITYGNQIDISVTDYLIYLKDDPDIDLFCLYLEGFKPYDGARFLAVAREIIGAGKKIIMYKTGRTAEGAATVASHTASMAGDFEVMHQVITDAGIIMPDTLQDVEDALKVFTLLAHTKRRGRRVGIFANAGFECSTAADRLYSMELARFSKETVAKLHAALPTEIIDVNNPIDATPQTNVANYGRCLEALLADDGVDCVMASVVPPTPFMETLAAAPGHTEDIRSEGSYPSETIRIFKASEKPMVVTMDAGRLYDPAAAMMEDAGIPVFRKIDRAMKALDLFVRNR